MAAAWQDRLQAFCERVRNKVPEEHQQEAPPEIAKPVLEAVVFTGDKSPLMEMFEELLAKSIDKRTSDQISPQFASIVQNLSPIEAKLIKRLSKGPLVTMDLYDAKQKLIHRNLSSNFKYDEFHGSDHFLTVMQHLATKNLLAAIPKTINVQDLPPGTHFDSEELTDGKILHQNQIQLTMYGYWFAKTCVPVSMPHSGPVRPK